MNADVNGAASAAPSPAAAPYDPTKPHWGLKEYAESVVRQVVVDEDLTPFSEETYHFGAREWVFGYVKGRRDAEAAAPAHKCYGVLGQTDYCAECGARLGPAAPAQVDAKVGEAIVEAQEAASAHGYCCRATEILSRHIGVLIAALRARSASPAPAWNVEHEVAVMEGDFAEVERAAAAHVPAYTEGVAAKALRYGFLRGWAKRASRAAASPAPTQPEESET